MLFHICTYLSFGWWQFETAPSKFQVINTLFPTHRRVQTASVYSERIDVNTFSTCNATDEKDEYSLTPKNLHRLDEYSLTLNNVTVAVKRSMPFRNAIFVTHKFHHFLKFLMSVNAFLKNCLFRILNRYSEQCLIRPPKKKRGFICVRTKESPKNAKWMAKQRRR